MEKLRILVIEDNEHHMQDVQHMLGERQKVVDLDVTYVGTLKQAYECMSVDGIISDVFFPGREGDKPENQAYRMVAKANEMGVPIVLCTDGDHHGPHLEGITNKLWSNESFLDMVDYAVNCPERIHHVIESRMKNWPKAYHCLMSKINPAEAENFEEYLADLEVNCLKGYWGPSLDDLKKVLR